MIEFRIICHGSHLVLVVLEPRPPDSSGCTLRHYSPTPSNVLHFPKSGISFIAKFLDTAYKRGSGLCYSCKMKYTLGMAAMPLIRSVAQF